MAITASELRAEVKGIFGTRWKTRQGQAVPEANQVLLGNDAVKLDATVLYADLIDSTSLVAGYKDWFAAEVFKAYLTVASKLIRSHAGQITAFDGDRVMAVFLGGSKNSNAARCALKLHWAVQRVVNPAIRAEYPDTAYEANHVVGIDSGSLLVAKTGIRGANDLVWVGQAANHAAKLCSLREGAAPTIITESVFSRLAEDVKYGDTPKRLMWDKDIWTETGSVIYTSDWWWEL